MSKSSQYVGLDVSLKETSICVIDDADKIVWRGQVESTPETIASAVKQHAPHAVRIGLESGQLSNWLFHGLKEAGLPVICVDARHAKAALSLKVNKTDANDALGLAQIMRVGWYREVTVKGLDCQAVRALLVARGQIVSQITTLKNCVRGILKTFGRVLPKGLRSQFPARGARRSTGIRYSGQSSSRRCGFWKQHGPNSSCTTGPSFNALAATTLPAS
jgi:transposase